ncbi:ethylene-responsive transcription factor ERF025-like [Lolium perenne]|uniref:ethylene-responsive transcription factor ERF025-like n=1 Tax=Lolium perenne TaxID=4522 RepID=UPI0021F6531B|nr:ethylene-responsive transcription factor ERF109-like [Lolium perenne]
MLLLAHLLWNIPPRPAASPRHASPLLFLAATSARPSPRCRRAGRGSSGFRGIRVHPNGTFYVEIRVGSFHVTLGTFTTPELAARAYDTAAWRFWRPRRDLNFQDVELLEEAEFLAPVPRLVSEEDRRHHCENPSSGSVADGSGVYVTSPMGESPWRIDR